VVRSVESVPQAGAASGLANIDPQRDMEFVAGPTETLDHASRMRWWGTKVGIDATRTWPLSEGFSRLWPEDIVMSPEVKRKIESIWSRLNIER